MYGLDINFLKDREIRPVDASSVRPAAAAAAAPGDRTPMFIGLAVAIAALGLVGGYWFLLQQQIRGLQAREAELDAEIADLEAQLQQIETINAQVELVKAENQSFANIFNEIRPWSVLLQELRERIPARVQLAQVRQTAGATPPGSDAEAVPPREGGIELDGIACDFDDINDFMLILQRSPLIDGESVGIVEAQRPQSLGDSSSSTNLPLVPVPQFLGNCPGTVAEVPDILVEFTLQANLTPIPASDLLAVLDEQGSVGLATRIRALRDTGVIESGVTTIEVPAEDAEAEATEAIETTGETEAP
ncbi:MAG: PilN domain-containing protein [Cyanobacteria bacterium J06639_14]